MVKITCSESGVEFEAATARAKQHPRIAMLKADANKRGNYREVNEVLAAVRKAGGYTTIDEFMLKIDDVLAGNKTKQAEADKRYRAAVARDAEADKQRKIEREQQNVRLKANGYNWRKEDYGTEDDMFPGSYGAGMGEYTGTRWVLISPDFREVTVTQALDEIARSVEIVKAEREAAAKVAAEKKAQEAQQKREAEQQERDNIAAFDAQVAQIKQDCQPVDVDWNLTKDWPVIAQTQVTSSYRRHDKIEQGEINGAVCYKTVIGTGYDDDGRITYYCADPEKAGLTISCQPTGESRFF